MSRALALTQFFIVGLGGPALHLLVRIARTDPHPEALASLAHFLARYVLWLFAVPVLYAAISAAFREKLPPRAVRIAGIVLCIALLLLLGIPIVTYLA